MIPMSNVKVDVDTWQNSETSYKQKTCGPLLGEVSFGVHQQSAKPMNFVAWLMELLGHQEMLSILQLSSRAFTVSQYTCG